MSRSQLANRLDNRVNEMPKGQVLIKSGRVDALINKSGGEQGTQFGSKGKLLALNIVIKWFDSQAIAGNE